MEADDVLVYGSLAWYLRRHADGELEEGIYFECVDLFPEWCEANPDEAATFKALLAEAIVNGSVTAEALCRVCGHVSRDAEPADVEEALRDIWFDLFALEPIAGDRHPLPEWWRHWISSPYITYYELESTPLDELEPFDFADPVSFLARHGVTRQDLDNMDHLFNAIVPPGDRLLVYIGYRRMLRARWEAGDRTAIPSLPPDPDDLAEAIEWVDWYPTD